LRAISLGRKAQLFTGGERGAIMLTLIQTAN